MPLFVPRTGNASALHEKQGYVGPLQKISRMMIARKAARGNGCRFPHYAMLTGELMFGNEAANAGVAANQRTARPRADDRLGQRRESLLACARLFACDTRPIVDRGSLMFRRRLGIAVMPSRDVGSFAGRANCCALRSESARRAASPSSFFASNFCRRANSLLTR